MLSVGAFGTGPREFRLPQSCAIDPVTDNLFVTDPHNRRLLVLSASTLEPLNEICALSAPPKHGRPPPPGDAALVRLLFPRGVAVDPVHSALVIVDRDQHCLRVVSIQEVKHARAPRLLRTIGGASGSRPGELHYPEDLAICPATGMIFVCDSLNHRVSMFTHAGAHVMCFGGYGQGPAQLNWPTFICFDHLSNTLLLSDSGNARVVEFSLIGAPLRTFGRAGTGPGEFAGVGGICIEPTSSRVLVADQRNHRINVFSRQGAPLCSFGAFGYALGLFNSPYRPLYSPLSNAIFVIDSGNHRIQCFNIGAASNEVVPARTPSPQPPPAAYASIDHHPPPPSLLGKLLNLIDLVDISDLST